MSMSAEQIASTLLDLRGRATLTEPLADLIDAAVRYARLRVDWTLMDHERRAALEATRTAAHEVLIDACNILSRRMAKDGEDNQWRADLGTDRRLIGDMACHLHCLLGVAGR